MRLRSPDVVFYHPPAIYDFRERPEFFGPISDVIPSSPIFEMYPVGLTTVADHLESNGYDVQLINLAHEMLRDVEYDAEREIETCPADVVGIDLHWLPHAQGATEVAKLVKKHHPDVPVVFGGLAASYYDEELVTYPWVDYVVRGDSTRDPMLRLVDALAGDGDLADVPNLTYRRGNETVVNPLQYVPDSLDYAPTPSYSYVIRSVMKYGSIQKVVPYRGWLEDPVTMLLTVHGCTFDCSFCGGSASAYRDCFGRDEPAYRSPEILIEDIRQITSFSAGPIFVVGDVRMAGQAYTDRLFDLLAGTDVENTVIFELFSPADADFFERADAALDSYSIELSIESASQAIRRRVGKFGVPNEVIESTIRDAVENGCEAVDLFFMIGLPEQTTEDVMATVEYIDDLMDRFAGENLKPFIAPLAPFLDPGSPAFENPEAYGYTLFCESFEDHRQAMLSPTWKGMLNYETDWMSRDEIVEVTYEAARRFNEIKFDHGRIDRETFETVRDRIERSREIMAELADIEDLPPAERGEKLRDLHERYEEFGEYSICGESELSWSNTGLRDVPQLVRVGLSLAADSLRRRLRG
ncbi:MAG: TIGR04190 family B12-binding domain/radical SAM domain protein [Halorhabdus sp.]